MVLRLFMKLGYIFPKPFEFFPKPFRIQQPGEVYLAGLPDRLVRTLVQLVRDERNVVLSRFPLLSLALGLGETGLAIFLSLPF
jgi:hypothetical protein